MADEGVALLQTRAGVVKRNTHADVMVRAAPSVAFIRDEGHMCGACGDGNNLHIGIGGHHFDEVNRAKAMDVCGPVCERHAECGGFNFVESLHRCYYRRVTSCQQVEDATHDCYTKSAVGEGLGQQVHELAAMRSYILDQGRMCGACGAENNMALGINNKPFDLATRETAAEVCGTKCSQHEDCGGFNFIESLGNCYYRKLTSCQASQDVDRDCYTKTSEAHTDGFVDEPQASLVLENKALEKTLRKRSVALKHTKAHLSQLQLAVKARDQIGKEGEVSEAQDVKRGVEEYQTDQKSAGESDSDKHDPLPEVVEEELAVEQGAPIISSIGASATLDQDGYMAVVAADDSSATKEFVRRVVADIGCEVADDGGLEGLVQFYNRTSSQTYDGLRSELLSVSAISGSWLSTVGGGEESKVSTSSSPGRSATLDEEGYASVANSRDDTQMEEFVRRVAAQLGCIVIEDTGLRGFVPFYSSDAVQTFARLQAELLKVSQAEGAWLVPSTEVAARKEEEESKSDLLSDELEPSNAVPFGGFEADGQVVGVELPLMQDHATNMMIDGDNFIGTSGSSVQLDEEGYTAVVALWDDAEMEKFVERAASQLGCNVTDRGGLEGFVPFYSKANAQHFAMLKAELLGISTLPGSWLVARTDAAGSSSAPQNSTHEMEKNNTVPVEPSMMESESETDSHYHAGELLAAVANSSKMLWQIPTIWDPRSVLKKFNSFSATGGPSGATAALSTKGVREVAALENSTEMAMFVQRMADDLDYEVIDEDGLADFVKLSNMTEQNYTSLESSIVSASKVEGSWVLPVYHGPSKTQMLMGAMHEMHELASRASQAMAE